MNVILVDPPEQIVVTPLILAVATGLIVTTKKSLTATHAPTGSSVVMVNVTVPAAIAAALGVYVPTALFPALVNPPPLDEVH